MKLIKKAIERDSSGYVVLCAEEMEDMWHVFNLIAKGDQIKASTVRRVQSESSTGSVDSSRIRVTLTVEVEDVEFDAQVGQVMIKGRNIQENKYVKLGAYHTMDLEMNKNFTLYKPEWDMLAFERIDQACNIAKRADVAAIVCQEGLANICLLTQHMTVLRQRIETPIPRKRKGSTTNYEKGLHKFYQQIYDSILRHFDFSVLKGIIIASPGFVKEQLYDYIFATAIKTDNKIILENKPKFMQIHCSGGHIYCLTEVLTDPAIQNKLSDTKSLEEVRALDRFYNMMNNDPDRAFYGWDHVEKANERGAIETLLLSDNLFRNQNVQTRRKYIAIVESVKRGGGKVLIFSSLHQSGEQLNQLTGIAAILNFPVPDIDEDYDAEYENFAQSNPETDHHD